MTVCEGPYPFEHFANVPCTSAAFFCGLVERGEHRAIVSDYFLSHLCCRDLLTFKRVEKARHDGVLHVLSVGAPFEVRQAIVSLVAVDMVHFRKIVGVWDECFG